MSEQTNRKLAYEPQDLERLLVSRQHAGDAQGMAALYEPDALLDSGEGRLFRGREAIRKFYGEAVAAGQKFQVGLQRAPLVCGDWRSPQRLSRTAPSPPKLPGSKGTEPGSG